LPNDAAPSAFRENAPAGWFVNIPRSKALVQFDEAIAKDPEVNGGRRGRAEIFEGPGAV